ncbi:MAG: TIGR02757 family protein [Desulfatiglandales bacterium]
MNETFLKFDKKVLEALYAKYNKREYVSPDPLQFLYNFQDIQDREIVGFISATLAYGRVDMILKTLTWVFERMEHPKDYLTSESTPRIERDFSSFKHRFTKGKSFSKFLITIKEILEGYGSIKSCFLSFLRPGDPTVLNALYGFSKLFGDCRENSWCLVPDPGKNSPMKRMNLFLRWMVREDEVDPGGWNEIRPSMLIVPLDVHMYRFGIRNGLIRGKTPSLRAALELTEVFRLVSPQDPVKYDFVITRPGIWANSSLKEGYELG